MKFSELPYARPELDAVKAELTALADALESAATPEAALDAYRGLDAISAHLSTMEMLVYVRHTLDTNDAFYDAEQQYFDETLPLLGELNQRVERALLASPHRAAMEQAFGTLLFRNMELSLKTFSPEIVADLQEENKLVTTYQKLLASAKVTFDGKELTLPQLAPYRQSPDRTVRRAATETSANWFMSNAETLDSLFDRLVKVRTAMARKLGYENFIELGYCRMKRNCYDKDMVEQFRAGVRNHLVSVAGRCKAEQAARIDLPRLTVYDDTFLFPDGNAKPFGTADEMLAHARKMYHELSPETGAFIDTLLEQELIDVHSRQGKALGGYCAPMPEFNVNFIFANFNGTADDVDVLTHEAGHAFAFHQAKDLYPTELKYPSYETCEVHSMSMEFLTWPWMEGFFGEQTAKYRYAHLAGALDFIPYGTMVDEFQHRVYESPEMTPAERNALWLSLESVYRPYLDSAEIPFYAEGRRWQAQSHIYERPFYYIDYCLAQSVALAFWALAQDDHAAAWAKYLQFVSFAGTKTFTEQVDGVGFHSPFGAGMLKTVAAAAEAWLGNQPKL